MDNREIFENIPVPNELDEVIDRAIRRAEKRYSPVKQIFAAAACLALVLFTTANTPLYTYAQDVPVIGDVVRVFRIGTGGEITDGQELGAESEGGSVQLTFGEASTAPVYEVERFAAPERVVITMHGVRFTDRNEVIANIEAAEGVAGAYFALVMDDSMMQLVVELERGFDCTVTELADPAGLKLDFTGGVETTDETVWYLRSESMPRGENLAMLCEHYGEFNPHQVRTASGNFAVIIGAYASEEEAEAALAELPQDAPFYVSSSKQYEPLGD